MQKLCTRCLEVDVGVCSCSASHRTYPLTTDCQHGNVGAKVETAGAANERGPLAHALVAQAKILGTQDP